MRRKISAETVATKLDDGSIRQARLIRIVAFEAGIEVIQGIALAELVLKVDADADITMDVTVHAAHTRSDEDYCDLALATTLMLYLEHATDPALWSNVDNDYFTLELDAVPMSSDADSVAEPLFELLTDEIDQGNFAINRQGEIESESDFFEFDTIAPNAIPG